MIERIFVAPWLSLTRLGEAQILLPLVLVAALWLCWRAGEAAFVRRWLFWLCAAAGLTTASKLAFIGWGWGVEAWDFTGISGHAMFAAASLPGLAWVLARSRGEWMQKCAVGLAFALAALIAYSRLEVGAHSPSEAVLGFVIGSAASLMSLRQAPALRLHPPAWLPAGVLAALMLLPFHAPPSKSHDWVTRLSLQLSGRSLPFHRWEPHRRPAAPKAQSAKQKPAFSITSKPAESS
ncbi:membrane-associated phospholipid phosphatase [Paucibacter oligotrophus]|uniref:Membrane-associated phospholipid phosphatase n=1 Tax=Roseateles oligotrophus TaxID=1769250 RepID=A0A840LCX7_9BURK|nr:phosphatase PAP2 family protein [Roseateles oligotrophus]MBB4846020.1 membrane-associated phospholipid phosphatase [Roseateles oligotrophus]